MQRAACADSKGFGWRRRLTRRLRRQHRRPWISRRRRQHPLRWRRRASTLRSAPHRAPARVDWGWVLGEAAGTEPGGHRGTGCPPGADHGVAPRRSIVLHLFFFLRAAPNQHPDRRAGTASRSASSSCSAWSRPSRTLASSTSTTEWRRQEQWSSHRMLVGCYCCHSSGVAGSALSPFYSERTRGPHTKRGWRGVAL